MSESAAWGRAHLAELPAARGLWLENPRGDPGNPWTVHPIAEIGNIETTHAWAVDADGTLEIVSNTSGGPLEIFKLESDPEGRPSGRFRHHAVSPGPSGHGLGFGDINGDGRPEIPAPGKDGLHRFMNRGSYVAM